MTDKEIEQALLDLVTVDLPDGNNYDSCGRICVLHGLLMHETLDYINRLKANIKTLQALNDRLCIEAEDKSTEQKKQTRKDTAKEIVRYLYDWVYDRNDQRIGEDVMFDLCDKYGVEVD